MKGSRPLTEGEIKRVVKSFTGQYATRDRALFILGIKTGFRISEILSLRVKDVWNGGEVVDRVTVQRRNMKKKIEGRTVLLNLEAKKALAAWVEELHEDGFSKPNTYLFQSRKGRNRPISPVQAYRILQKAFETNQMAGRLGTHAMRKTFAERIYQALKGDLVKTQRALGHKNINSTVSYLSFREEEIDQAIMTI